jgi:acyl-coenzyme A synthetase/AMP-(fatty) acid ligase
MHQPTTVAPCTANAPLPQDVVVRGGKVLPLYSRLIGADAPPAVVLAARGTPTSLQLRTGDAWWSDFEAAATPLQSPRELPHIVDASAQSNILFSSGTTVRTNCTALVHDMCMLLLILLRSTPACCMFLTAVPCRPLHGFMDDVGDYDYALRESQRPYLGRI